MSEHAAQLQPILSPSSNNEFADFDYGAASASRGPTRASYAPTSGGKRLLNDEVTGSSGGRLRRAKSMPTLTRHELRHIVPMSPFFYRRYYMSKAGTLTSSAFNLVSATLGAGVLALPSAMSHSGVLMGSIALALICIMTVYSVYLLVKVSDLVDLSTYEEMAEELIGPIAEKLTAFVVVIFCWGVAVMFVVVMGDFVSPLIARLGLASVLGRQSGMIVFWSLLMFPLSLAREINSLRFASFIGAVTTLLLAMALAFRVMRVYTVEGGPSDPVPLAIFDSNALSALSTYLFSFCCQPVVFRVRAELHNGTTKRMSICATWAMTGCTLLYIVTGVCGTIAFGRKTEPNVLSNLSGHLDELYVLLAYFSMAIAVTMVFPMTIFPTRDSVVLAMGYHPDENPCPGWLSSTVAGILALLALIFGMFVPNIRVLFDLLGGVCGGTLSFLLPGLFALRCGAWTVREVGLVHFVSAWVLTLMGAGMCVLGTYCAVRNNFFP